jgi:DivIVA domain-containing protein
MSDNATEGRAPARTPRVVTPLEIQQKEFAVSRFGGYRMKDVDEFLDDLTESVSALQSENDRLRRQAGAASPIVGAPDLDDVARQADEIIQRARDEAARIVAEAKERSASIAGASAASATSRVTNDEERAAVNAFLAQEREFLQGLAALVQGHAESVKGMARKAREVPQAAPTGTPPASTPVVSDREPEPASSDREPEPVAEAAARADAGDERTQALPAVDEPIRVDEPERTGAPRKDEGDASLRDLFWNEDD